MGRNVTDTAKPPSGRGNLPFENRIDIRQTQICEADNPGANFRPAAAPVALLGDRSDEFALADRPHFLGTPSAIARTALDEHGRDDVMPGVDVREQLVEQVSAPRVIPQVMMRVDDRE